MQAAAIIQRISNNPTHYHQMVSGIGLRLNGKMHRVGSYLGSLGPGMGCELVLKLDRTHGCEGSEEQK